MTKPNEGDSSIRRKACNPKCDQINDELHVWKVWHAHRRGNLNLMSLEALNSLVGVCQVQSSIKIGELYLVSYLPRLPLQP
jgi:hypothetical protein